MELKNNEKGNNNNNWHSSIIYYLCYNTAKITDRRMIAIKENGDKEYYIMSVGGITPVTRHIEEDGYMLVDDYKMWNPHPLQPSAADYVFIKEKLSEWLAGNSDLKQWEIQEINTLTTAQIKDQLKYVFTDFNLLKVEDFYLLKLQYRDEIYRVYIGMKPVNYNIEKSDFEYNVLMYPFYNENWSRNFYRSEKEYLKMRDLEENGYNKYFKN